MGLNQSLTIKKHRRAIDAEGLGMKRLIQVIVCCMFFISGNCMNLTVHVESAGNLINQIDLSKVEEVDSLTIWGDLNGTDILVIRKMCNLSYIDMRDANIVNGGQSYHENFVVSQNTIGSYFFNTRKKVKIFLPNSVTTINKNCLGDCLEEVDLTIGENTESIVNAFSGSRISTVKLPNNIKLIGENAFSKCRDLKEINLPESVCSIGERAFYECYNLAEIHIGPNLKEFYYNAFQDVNVEKIYIKDLNAWLDIDFKNIASTPASYEGKTKLILNGEPIVELIIPNGIERIKQYAFYGISIESAKLPNTLKFIGESAFRQCGNLKSITLGDDIEEIQDLSFSESGISEIKLPLNLTSIAYGLFSGCKNLSKVVIPQGITSIGEYAFSDCTNLTELSLPGSITNIGFKAFEYCESLNNLYFEDGSEKLKLEAGHQGQNSDYFHWTFYRAPLCNVYVGRNISANNYNYNKGPFDGTKIEELVFGDLVTSVENYLFDNCTSIKKVSFGKNVEVIERTSFNSCTNIVDIISLNATPPKISNDTFNETIYKKVTLYIPKGSKTFYWLDPVWSKFQYIEEIESSTVVNIETDLEDHVSVFTLSGVKIQMSSIKLLNTLPKGIYIINGKKILKQ